MQWQCKGLNDSLYKRLNPYNKMLILFYVTFIHFNMLNFLLFLTFSLDFLL